MKQLMMRTVLLSMMVVFFVSMTQAENSPIAKHSDAWLEAKLATTYMFTRHLDNSSIDTEVKNGTAFIKGYVDSDIQKDLAGEIAKSVEGIQRVENMLVVDKNKIVAYKQERKDQTTRSFGQVVDDLSTTASIKTRFLTDQNIAGLKINVDTKYGIVTLQGKVASPTEKALAEQIAANAEGVRSVDNELTVDPNAARL